MGGRVTMKYGTGLRAAVMLSAIAVLLLPGVAAAYIDPGTGSYILQMVLGGLLGGLFAIKVYWKKITAFFRKKSLEKKVDAETRAE